MADKEKLWLEEREVESEQETKLTSMHDLVQALRSEKQRYSCMANEAEAEKVKYQNFIQGGKRKMARSKLGLLAALGVVFGLGYNAYESRNTIREQSEVIDNLKGRIAYVENTYFTGEEWNKFSSLKNELNQQVLEANNCMRQASQTADGLKGFVDQAKDYIEMVTPRGELEESVAQKVDSLNSFFDSYASSVDQLQSAVDECYQMSDKDIGGLSKSESREQVSKLNEKYVATLNQIKENAEQGIEKLAAFKEYASQYPVVQKRQMVERTDQEIEKMSNMVQNLETYISVFTENSKSKAVIPVALRNVEEKADVYAN